MINQVFCIGEKVVSYISRGVTICN